MLKQKIRKVVSFALATTMSIAMAVTGVGNDIRGVHAASNDLSSQVNFSTILGRGVDYGIIAENFQLRSHMQTTYAVGSFSCACDGVPSEANLNPVGSTAHFLIGDVVPAGQEQYSRTTKGPVYAFVGGDGTNNLVVEASENVYAQEEGKDSNFKSQNFANTDKIVDNNTTQHVKDLCDSVFGVSTQLSVKATSDDAIDYRDYFTTTGGGKGGDKACLDLTSGDFANKVVYIDVDDDLLAHMNVADNFNIIKDSSTVIVFNIGPDVSTNSTVRSDNDYAIKGRHGLKEEEFVTLSTYSVSVDNGNSWIRTTSSTGQDGKEDETAKANYEETRKLDMEVNQKIIWNITTNHEVALDASAGLFIVPNAFVDVIGSSTGWVVAKDIANTTGEWHYTYCGNVFENKNAIGKLTVKKVTTGNVPAGYTSTYKFTVKTNDDPALYVQDENGTLGLAEHVFDVTAGDEAGTLIEKIDVTKKYIVEEVAPENLGDSLTCETTYDNNTVDYTDKKEATVVINNDFKRITGSLTVSKVEDGDVNGSGKPSTYSFYIKSGDKYVDFSDHSNLVDEKPATPFSVSIASKTTVDGLVAGRAYTVEEADVTGLNSGFTYKPSYVYDGNASNAAASITKYKQEATAEITNSFNQAKTVVTLSKKDINGTGELKGAELRITTDAAGQNVVNDAVTGEALKWISTDVAKQVSLVNGVYYMTETTAPEGYDVSETVAFEVENGFVTKVGNAGDVKGTTVTMFDAPTVYKTNVKISKQAVGGGAELEGAEFTLTGEDESGKSNIFKDENVAGTSASVSKSGEVITFVSGKAPTEIKNLLDGTYTLVEKAAPEGYEIASSIRFTIKNGEVVPESVKTEVQGATPAESGYVIAPEGTYTAATGNSPTVITMFDAVKVVKPTVEISKQDIYSNELPGATLTLTGKAGDNTVIFTEENISSDKIKNNGETIEFVSGDAPTTIKNLPDGKYTLHEEVAPSGYLVATNIEFEIKDGKVVPGTNVTAATEDKNAVITMVDDAEPVPEPDKTDVKISKQAVGGGAELEGATFTLTGKTLDADGNTTSENVTFTTDNTEGTNASVSKDSKTITFESGKAPTEIKNLPDGTYTLVEKAAPEGYEIASSIIFTIRNGAVV
nr:hypothetical protein [Eubacterium sp.]